MERISATWCSSYTSTYVSPAMVAVSLFCFFMSPTSAFVRGLPVSTGTSRPTATLRLPLQASSFAALPVPVPIVDLSGMGPFCPRIPMSLRMSATDDEPIISPFDAASPVYEDASKRVGATATTGTTTTTEYLDLTWENVEKVLDEMRPYLIQDGGNVVIADIDGPVVKLELQGACGTCPSSTQTLKMGLERGLKEKIPEIQEVVQSLPEGPPLVTEQVDIVLDGVRPFLQVVGGTIDVDRIEGIDSLQPTIWLHMQGNSASLNSVKLEIAQRLQRHFMMSGLQIQWKE